MFWLVVTAAFVYFGTTVQLGKRTLFGHLVAIARTREAQDLADGTKEEAGKVAERMRRDLAKDGGAPAEQLDDKDREELRKLLKEKAKK
jgi:hypothetical protein